MQLHERQQSILEALIAEHVRTARPVASQELVRRFRLGVSPATIRNEMQELDRLGYLVQPHTSAGRVPTDRGYRYFVDHLLEDEPLSGRDAETIGDLFAIGDAHEFIREFSRAASRLAETFAAAGTEDGFYETGFSEVLAAPEFSDAGEVRRFGKFVDELDGALRRLLGRVEDDEFFIGEENPLREARSYTMTVAHWSHPRGYRGFITMVGPRRANYRKQAALIKAMRRLGA